LISHRSNIGEEGKNYIQRGYDDERDDLPDWARYQEINSESDKAIINAFKEEQKTAKIVHS
jgi:hypothetical protein